MSVKRLSLEIIKPGFKAALSTRAFCSSPSNRSTVDFHPCPPELTKDDNVKPIVVLFGWLLAKSRHLEKYGSIYQKLGADVMTVKLEVAEVLRPKKAEQTAIEVLERLTTSDTQKSPLLVHGFSVGGYLYSQVLNQIINSNKYTPVKERILGQVFDSPVDFQGIPHGVSNAALKNPVLRSIMKNTIKAYLKATEKYTSKIYEERSELFYNNPVQSPSLFLFSKSDEVSDSARCKTVADHWKNNLGMDVTSKCWDNSPHVSHFYVHTNDYIDAVNNFVEHVMTPKPSVQN